jgi:streptogramin lyase
MGMKADNQDDRIGLGIRRRIDRLAKTQAQKGAQVARATPSRAGHPAIELRLSAGWVTPAVLLAVIVILVATGHGNKPLPAAPGIGATVSASPKDEGLRETSRFALPGPIYDLAFDSSRNALWFAYMSSDPDDALYRFDLASQHLSHWALPPTDHNGFLMRVVVAPDGSIWTTEEYKVVRFDPASMAMASRTFPLPDADATATALSKNDSSPGTWLAAIGFDGEGNALVSRHNVTSLIRLDSGLNVLGRIPLPNGMVGPGDLVDVGGVIYATAYSGDGPTEIFNEAGVSKASVDGGGARLAEVATNVASVGPGGVVQIDARGVMSRIQPIGGSPDDRIAATATSVAVYSYGPSRIMEQSVDGSVLGTLMLQGQPVQKANPMGSVITVYAREDVGAIATDGQGSIWYVDVTTPALVHLQTGG